MRDLWNGRTRLMVFGAATAVLLLLVVSLHGASESRLGATISPTTAATAQPSPIPTGTASSQALTEGKTIFRFETFGDEAFWGGALQLHKAIAGANDGGTGPGLSPKAALGLGLKVDVDALPADVVAALKNNQVNLDDPVVTLTLLKADAVVGVKGFFNQQGQITSIGINCALCHSTVDNSITAGIGHRLDGWANRDLDVGKIVVLAPNLQPFANLLGVDVPTVQKVLNAWGPGKFDAALAVDGQGFAPDGNSAATLIPPAFGLAGQNLHTYTGWGSIPYWNAFVANIEMHGSGRFFDPRLNDAQQFPVAVKAKEWDIANTPDLITPKLAALHVYQLSLPAPTPPAGSYDAAAASRGQALFEGKAQCSICHTPPLFSEPGWPIHKGAEIGIDDFQASRSPAQGYRTAVLKGLWTHVKGGFFHDGRFATLNDVVNHYNAFFNLGLTAQEMSELVEYLKSL
jgi:hypothetical protein